MTGALTTTQVLEAATILGRGYDYEQYEEVPIVVAEARPGGVTVPASGPTGGTTDSPPVALPATAGSASGVALSNQRVNLNLRIDRPEIALPAAGGGRLYIAVKDLNAEKAPGDNFAIYINLPEGQAPDPKGKHFAGVINFFGALATDKVAAPAGGQSGHGAHDTKVDRLIDVTDRLSDLRAAGLWDGGNLAITIVPVRGNVDASSQVRIGGVELIRQ